MNFNPLLYSSSDLNLYPGQVVVLLSLLSNAGILGTVFSLVRYANVNAAKSPSV